MLIRSRSARFAALALAITTPLVAATAGPVFALGENATATLTSPAADTSSTFTWSYEFHQNGGNALSNIAIGFCSSDILEDVLSADAGGADVDFFYDGDVEGQHAGFGPGIKFNLPEDSGTITVTFKSTHPISEDAFRIESHSGKGGGDGVTKADGPGPCPSDPTDNGDNGDGGGGGGGDDDDTTVVPTDIIDDHGPVTTTETPSTSTNPAPTSEVLGVTLTDGSNPAPAAAPAASPAVSGNNAQAPAAELPHTGAGNIQFLMTLALSLLAAGVALRAAFGRRIRSASSPS